MTPDYIALRYMATELGVWVDVNDAVWLAGDAGGWFPDYDLILLEPGLCQIEQRYARAHESGHATHERHARVSESLHARQDRQADQFVAPLLVSPLKAELSERLYQHSPNLLAQELDATTYVVTSWQDLDSDHTIRQRQQV
ncbi:hypothetical protein BJP08_02320 [Corynebacterium sp. NML140438]|uniref:hypothetical protein n=1 Tax=Corynebacterium sp. NML140438 TaxID=1906334 RepID=UPI0008FB7DFD|nr:hypothetical protein [Corynebacterium sp. NML140438]OIR43991.1 hypothetical protein BJP08_02320 [Corynebacterium sp. NML140438]